MCAGVGAVGQNKPVRAPAVEDAIFFHAGSLALQRCLPPHPRDHRTNKKKQTHTKTHERTDICQGCYIRACACRNRDRDRDSKRDGDRGRDRDRDRRRNTHAYTHTHTGSHKMEKDIDNTQKDIDNTQEDIDNMHAQAGKDKYARAYTHTSIVPSQSMSIHPPTHSLSHTPTHSLSHTHTHLSIVAFST